MISGTQFLSPQFLVSKGAGKGLAQSAFEQMAASAWTCKKTAGKQ
jgi:hypothetical protein